MSRVARIASSDEKTAQTTCVEARMDGRAAAPPRLPRGYSAEAATPLWLPRGVHAGATHPIEA